MFSRFFQVVIGLPAFDYYGENTSNDMHVFHFRSSPETARPDRIGTDEPLYFIMEGKRDDQHGLQLLFSQQDFVDIRFGQVGRQYLPARYRVRL